MLRTFGLSFLQLPLINQGVAGLPPKDLPAGIAINNMIRQIGGAFGIAMANNYIAAHYAQHRNDLIANVYTTNPLYQERVATITNGIVSKTGDAITAATQATANINFAVDKQAYLLSYLDTFRLVSIFYIAIFPLIFLLKNKKVDAATVKAAAESH